MTTRKKLPTFSSQSGAMKLPAPRDGAAYVEYWHAGHAGFGVRVYKPTSKNFVRRAWVAKLIARPGRPASKPVIGTLADMDIEDATAVALGLRKNARVEKEQGIPAMPTLKEGYERLVADRSASWSDATKSDYDKRMKVIEDIDVYPLDELKAEAWKTKFKEIKEKSGEPQAKGVLRVVSVIYNNMLSTHDTLTNPISRISRDLRLYGSEEAKTKPVSAEDLPVLWAHLLNADQSVRDWVIFALFTGFRRELVNRARWDRVDFKVRSYRIASNDPGNKSRQEIMYPLPDWLCETVLMPRHVVRNESNPWMFPSTLFITKPTTNIQPFYEKFEEKTEIRMRPHMLRATFSTIADSVLNNPLLLSALLTHATGRKSPAGREFVPIAAVTAGYAKKTGSEIRDAINQVAEAIVRFAKAKGPLPMHPPALHASVRKRRRTIRKKASKTAGK